MYGSAEFALAVACSAWPPSPAREAAVRTAAGAVDWDLFGRVVSRQRVDGLVHDALRRAGVTPPEGTAATLADAARRIASHNLQAAAESGRLRTAFDAAGIPHLFLKGLTLGVLVYGSPTLKMGWDIDLLVSRDRVEDAAALLDATGYRLRVPRPGRRDRIAAWHDRSKESTWHEPDRDLCVELHTRLVDNVRLLPEVGLGSPPLEVEVVKGVALPTLGRDEYFAYLCVHGASSAWFRLKWIADIAAWLAAGDAEETARLYRTARALGAGRAADQALLLAHTLFAAPVDPDLLRRLESDRVSNWLYLSALAQMSAPAAVAAEPTARRLGTLAIHVTQLGLLPGFGFKLSEASRQLGAVLRGDG